MVVVELIITGVPRVKKNNQRYGVNRRTQRVIKYNTEAYKTWHKSALEQLAAMGYDPQFAKLNKKLKELGRQQRPALIDYAINFKCLFFMPNEGRVDLSALYEGIQDLAAEVGIIKDDNYKIIASHDGSGVFVDKENPRMEITITKKLLTVYAGEWDYETSK
jgi:hypothetical protein